MTAETGKPRRTARAAGSGLDPDSRVPLYQQIVVILSSRIAAGDHAPGTLLPGEHELAAEFGVSRITGKRALDELSDAGLVRRERGRGTRVLERPAPPAVRASIEGWLENVGHMQRTTSVRLLEFGYLPAPAPVADALELPAGAEVQRTVRVRVLEGAPLSCLVCFLPAEVGRTFGEQDLGTTPLLKLLERAGIEVVSARQRITATLASAEVAPALKVHAGAPLLEVRRIVRDAGGRPVQYIRALYRPDLYQIEMSMARIRSDDGMTWAAGTEDAPGLEPALQDAVE